MTTPHNVQSINRATDVVGGHKDMSVLVVGNGSFANEVEQMLLYAGVTGSVTPITGYLMALGHVVKNSPRVVICRIEDLDNSVESIGKAFRQLSPHARLIIVAGPNRKSEAVEGIKADFDDYLIDPIDAIDLGRAVEAARCPDADSIHQVHRDEDPWLLRHTMDRDSASIVSPETISLDMSVSSSATFGSAETHHLELPDNGPIDRLLQARGSVREAALSMIANQTGISDIAWSAQAKDVPSDRIWVSANHNGHVGVLHVPRSSNIDIEQMRRWGNWLGKWLALDHHVNQLWRLAMHDELTGLWNRRYFDHFLKSVLARATDRRFNVTLMIFDIDDFKTYNDRYGHPAGDEILRETAKLMQSLVRGHDVVARIGGDEFAVIFWDAAGPRRANSSHPHDPIKVAQRFQKAVGNHRFPKLGDQAPGTLTISGGLAGFPWDGHTPEELLDLADKMAIQSKRQGKNIITFGSGAQRNCQR